MGNARSAPVLIGGALENCCGSTKHRLTENDDFDGPGHSTMIRGSVVLKKKNFLDTTDITAHFVDRFHEWFGKRVSVQLVSAVNFDPANPSQGKLGKAAHIENWSSTLMSSSAEDEAKLDVNFEWDESIGVPGAFVIKNNHNSEFYLKTLTLKNVPGHSGPIHFICNSWVYPAHRYTYERVFFVNTTYLPNNTPEPLKYYREQELINLRGSGSGMLKEWDRVYDYDYYNDLGLPDKGEEYKRPVLGGSEEFPYPRRTRTGRPSTKTDPRTESRLPLLESLDIYIPRDEKFSQIKLSEFLAYALKSAGQVLTAELEGVLDKTPNDFDTFQDILDLYKGGIKKPNGVQPSSCIPWALVKELGRSDGEKSLNFPLPDVISVDKSAWRTDEEFGREMLAGVNPVVIRLLQEFPPTSKLNPITYGNQNSELTKEDVEMNMNGLTVKEAIENNKLFILDHHDTIMPYLRKINQHTSTKTYASRTILLLQDDGTLKPLAIELSLPHHQGDGHGANGQVFMPAEDGVEGAVWKLAKAYVAVNDSGVHQLISHWLNTHAVIEPFIIATHRHLSVLHPLHKLLQPHFKDTMNINALARQTLINAGGILETTVFPSKFAMEMSAVVYKNWNLLDHALPADLLKRGVAVQDPTQKNGLKLLIEDYPFAVDGLEIWSAISTWVTEYLSFYYPTDESIQEDPELQSWWTEIRYEGHGDKRDETWWPRMDKLAELIDTCTIIIWIASALHAAVNYGQYPYAGYLPNRPTVSRRFMPESGSEEFNLLSSDPDSVFLKTITAQIQTLLGVSLIEILSRHSSDEVYLGQRDTHEWTSDERALEAFKRFSTKLIEIEGHITGRNKDRKMRNRYGPVKLPYTLLYPCTSDPKKAQGLTGMGIPNSVSI